MKHRLRFANESKIDSARQLDKAAKGFVLNIENKGYITTADNIKYEYDSSFRDKHLTKIKIPLSDIASINSANDIVNLAKKYKAFTESMKRAEIDGNNNQFVISFMAY